MIKLHDHPLSGNAYKSRLLLHQLGVEFERVFTDIFKGEHKTDEFSELNPNQKIPVLINGDFVMWESNAILLYLAKKFSPNPYISDNPEKYGTICQWVFFGKTSIDPNLAMARYLKSCVPDYDPKDLEKMHVQGNAALKILDDYLFNKNFLAGDYSIADIACYPYIMLSHEGGFDISQFANVKKWTENMENTERFLPFGD